MFYPFRTITGDYQKCVLPDEASWIEKAVITRGDSIAVFFNRYPDYIKIRLDKSYIAYRGVDSTIITVELTNHDTATFLELEDPVKIFTFSVFDENMDPVSHNLNDKSIIISKHYGLVKTLNFYLFPNIYSYIFYRTFEFHAWKNQILLFKRKLYL